jgi:ubiquinone/menaquinone biosynthesis C-methylase UbiE
MDLQKELTEYYSKYYRGVSPHWENIWREVLNEAREKERLDHLAKYISLQDKKILEIGSGFGSFVILSRKMGAKGYGIEPDHFCCRVAGQRSGQLKQPVPVVLNAKGERIPFRAGSFDAVAILGVLEHVQNPGEVLAEARRVLKADGLIYCIIPNYQSFWEGHYGVFWLPNLPKALARIYLRLLGRRVDFLGHLNLLNPRRMRRIMKSQDLNVISWGHELWRQRMQSSQFTEWGETRRLKKIVRLLKMLKLNRIFACLGEALDMYYPMVIIARKENKIEKQ